MVLPIPDLTGVIAAIDRNTNMMQNLVDELVRMNEQQQNDVDGQVTDIRTTLEQQYRNEINALKERLPQNDSPIPHGWSDRPTGPASPQ
jgi:hypothetical protein